VRIGLGGLYLQSQGAGVSRCGIRVADALSRLEPSIDFYWHVQHGFEPPRELLDRPNLRLVRESRIRTFLLTGGLLAKTRGYRAWIASAYDVFPFALVPQAAIVHDLFCLSHPEFFTDVHARALTHQVNTTARVCKVLFANSRFTKEEVVRLQGRASDDVDVVYHGMGNVQSPVDRAAVTPAQRAEWMIPEAPYLLALSTLEPRKNMPRLVEAFARIASQRPHLHLALVGGRGWKEGPIFEAIQRTGLSDRVVLPGYVPDEAIPAWYACSEAFVMPSLQEGFGAPLLEAMAYGAPVVSSNAGSLPELAGEFAVYFEPEDVAGMSDAIERRLATPFTPAERIAAQDHASAFTWERTAAGIMSGLRRRGIVP